MESKAELAGMFKHNLFIPKHPTTSAHLEGVSVEGSVQAAAALAPARWGQEAD